MEAAITPQPAPGLPSFGSSFVRDAPLDGDGYLSLAKRALLLGTHFLDTVPRDHPIWRNTNHADTPFKGLGRAKQIRSPAETQLEIWRHIASSHFHGAGFFMSGAWRKLCQMGRLDVRWPIHSAYYISAEFSEYASHGSCLSRDLARFLREEELCAAAEPVLRVLPTEVLPHNPTLTHPVPAAEWGMRVFHGMRHPELWNGITCIDEIYDQYPALFRQLLTRYALLDGQLLLAAVMTGYSGSPDVPAPALGEKRARKYADQARMTHAFFDEEERYAVLFAALGYGALAGMRDRGKLSGWAYRIGEEYLNQLAPMEFWSSLLRDDDR